MNLLASLQIASLHQGQYIFQVRLKTLKVLLSFPPPCLPDPTSAKSLFITSSSRTVLLLCSSVLHRQKQRQSKEEEVAEEENLQLESPCLLLFCVGSRI